VEYRWIWVTYFTFYALLNNTARNIDLDPDDTTDNTNTEKYNAMAFCVGQKDFRLQHSEFTASRAWAMSPDFEFDGGQSNTQTSGGCPALGPCQGHNPFTGNATDEVKCEGGLLPPFDFQSFDYSNSAHRLAYAKHRARGICLSKHDYVSDGDDYGSEPFIINMVGLALMIPMFLGLSLWQICCKRGGFDKSFTPDADYIQSLHNIQIQRWYRTYTNLVAVFALATGLYGLERLINTDATTSSIQTHVLGLIALVGVIPRPRRVAPTELVYDPELINKYVTKVSDWLTKVLVWTSTDFHEYHERLLKFEDNVKREEFGFEKAVEQKEQAEQAWEIRDNLFSLFCCF